jgi:predicted dehydrogenase
MTTSGTTPSGASPVRVGVLGAARILNRALLVPARTTPGVRVVAIAARSPERARAYAAAHGIPVVHPSYEALLESPDVDAVYVPLPPALHGTWTRRAITAGKHVLCEKPLTADAAEAAEIADLAAGSELVVMEAMHSRHHPMWTRLRELVRGGRIGTVRTARASLCIPVPPGKNIRWQRDLGGGALLDVGVYPIALLRMLLGEPEVLSARGRERRGVDAWTTARLGFAGGAEGEAVASVWSHRLFAARLDLTGSAGTLHATMPYHPQLGAVIAVRDGRGRSRERPTRTSTYAFQLAAFRDGVASGSPVVTDAGDALATMRVVEAVRRAAGTNPHERLERS